MNRLTPKFEKVLADMGIKDRIRAADDLKFEGDIQIPEWDPDAVFGVYGLPDEDWSAYRSKSQRVTMRQGRDAELAVKAHESEIVAKCLYVREEVDGPYEKVFSDVREGVAILAKKNAGIINGLFKLCRHLSDDDKEFSQKVREAEEDFGDGQS